MVVVVGVVIVVVAAAVVVDHMYIYKPSHCQRVHGRS